VQLVGFPTRIGGRVTGERADPPEDACDCQQMWPIWGALITAGQAEIVLILVERRTSSPMLPLELFSSSTFSAANVVGLLLNFGFYGQLFFINLFFQQIRGYSPLLAGLALLPETGVIWLADGLSGRVTAHTGPRFPMIVGSLIGAAGFLSMCLTDATTPRDQPRWNGKLQDEV